VVSKEVVLVLRSKSISTFELILPGTNEYKKESHSNDVMKEKEEMYTFNKSVFCVFKKT
jgi:hypothetical protein